jgi:tRNA(Ile)-lysidine synthase
VLHPKKSASSNLEEKLRDIRYHFLEDLRKKEGATLVAVAHHEDDQAETFLLRLLRGSGMAGLSAMRPKHGQVVRPLINTGRQDILRYLKERNIAYRTDGSNTDTKFLRNRLRHELLPLLEKEYQPKVRKILADTAALLASDYAVLETLPSKNDSQTFSVQELLALPEPVLKTKLRSLLKPHYQEKAAPKGLIEEIMKLLRSRKGKVQTLSFRGLKIERKGDTVRLLNF